MPSTRPTPRFSGARRTNLRAGAAAAALLLATAAQRSLALGLPANEVVLTISGRLRRPGARLEFDMAMLAALPQVSFTTRTPWYANPRKFTGPLLRDVLAAAGAAGSMLRAIALNDYWVDIPVADTVHYDVTVARLLDDQPLTVRDKGPLFVIYPFDSRPELHDPVHYGRSAWQLRTIEVR